MRKLLLSFLLLMAIGLNAKDYKVSTALEFVKALGSNRTIIVEGVINLSDVLENGDLCKELGMEAAEYDIDTKSMLIRNYETDGHMLTLNKVKNLTIKGKDGATILISPRYAYPLSFLKCKGIKLVNFTAGHTDEGYCTGGVLEFKQCEDIEIDRCDLFGCGIEGITATNTKNLVCKKSIIRDCSYSIMELLNCANMTFEDCDFYRCREFTMISIMDCTNTNFTRCRISQNEGTLFGLDNSEITLNECEIHHIGKIGNINLKKYPTTKFYNDNDDLEGRGFGPTGRSNMKANKEASEDGYEGAGSDCECGEEEEEEEWISENVAENHRAAFGSALEDYWGETQISLPQSEGTPNIFNLTLAFCKQWMGNDGDPRKILVEYATGKRTMKVDTEETSNVTGTKAFYEDDCSIIYNLKKGWLSSNNSDLSRNLEAGVWNRNNGHKLLIVVLEQLMGGMSSRCYCYDYDPTTRKLRPLPDLKKLIEMKHIGAIQLPRRGKDIYLNSNVESPSENIVFKWNGYSFSVKKLLLSDKSFLIDMPFFWRGQKVKG